MTIAIGVGANSAFGGVTVGDLCCEYRIDPLGIDATKPRLSWIMKSEARGAQQTAYQILVASDAEKLAEDAGDLWDSGSVESDRSIQIRYDGQPLASHVECFWKVRVWDQKGEPSAWSDPAYWTLGLLDPADWKAEWIGLDGTNDPVFLSGTNWIWHPEGDPTTAAPVGERYFRRVFELPMDRRVVHAEYLATADDQCKAFINGRDVGGRDNYRTVKQSDLTNDLHPGRNLIAIIGMNKGDAPSPAGVIGILTIEFDRGEPLVLITDDQWKASTTVAPGWDRESDFDDSAWVAAKVTGPAGMEPWGDVRAPEDRRLSARWLRREFNVVDDVRRATVYFSGLGLSELYLNGRKVGDHVLSPGATQYPERVFYVTYDVTDQLRSGANAIGAVLGN
jgi:alpha-L-rhamnosidase